MCGIHEKNECLSKTFSAKLLNGTTTNQRQKRKHTGWPKKASHYKMNKKSY